MTWGRKKKYKPGETRMGNTNSTCVLGHSHRSKLESAVCQLLQLRQKAKEIEFLQVEDVVYLSRARIKYVPDFRCAYVETREEFWVEAKGFENDRWPMIKKLWGAYGPGKLEIWKGTYDRLKLAEIITPASGGADLGE